MTIPPVHTHGNVPISPVVGTTVGTPLDALHAVNALLAEPWSSYIAAPAAAEGEAIRANLEGTTLAEAKGSAGSSHWKFSLKATNVNVDFDLTSPPGFSSLPQIQPAGSFTLEAPLAGTWRLAISGKLSAAAEVKLAGMGPSIGEHVDWGFGLDQIKLRTTVEFDGSVAAWPMLTRVTAAPALTLYGTGATQRFGTDVGFDTTIEPGLITLKTQLTNVSVDIGHVFDARLTANLTIKLRPSPTYSVDVAGRTIITMATVGLDLSVDGQLEFSLPNIGRQHAEFHLPVTATIPAPDMLSQFLSISGDGLPRELGKTDDSRGQTAVAPPNVDYAGVAEKVEKASRHSHMPFGAVFSIERRHADPSVHRHAAATPAGALLPFDEFYAKEEDSSLWTGHFLAAAALRQAATGDPDALKLVGDLLSGIERLFWVAEGDVVKDGQSSPGAKGGVFARSALPDTSKIRWWEADDNIAVDGRSYYERSDDEFVATRGSEATPHPASARTETPLSASARRDIPVHIPTTWRGIGCGDRNETDHPLSRDQYAGVFYGLFAAHQFVADDGIRLRTRVLMTKMLDFLLANDWNVPLPPEGAAIRTSYLGAFDHQLAFLRIGATIAPARFGGHYNRVAAASAASWLPIWLSAMEPMDGYFKFNLTHAVISPTLLAEEDPALRNNYRRAYDILRRATGHHRNAYFNLVRILVESPGDRAAASLIASGSNPHLSLAEEIKGTLAEWVARLDKVKSPSGLPTDKVPNPDYLLGLWPDVKLYTTISGGKVYISPFALAVDKRIGDGMGFAWERDPFRVGLRPGPHNTAPTTVDAGAGDPLREGPAVDYLLAYWLAVYLGVLPGAVAPT
jgi:hypothetical protein